LAHWRQSRTLSAAAYYNLTIAAAAVVPTLLTGLLAWRWQLEGAPLRGVLRLHLLLGATSGVLILLCWWFARRIASGSSSYRLRIAIEGLTVAIVAVTAHLGGVVSGVNI
jgi:hypothetical protein